MIDFATVRAVTVPEGAVVRITDASGRVLWEQPGFLYVSLGDSIAAGHAINSSWEADYGEGSQYGKNGNASTAIVPGCYTDRIASELSEHTVERAWARSFARSGDTVADLMAKLSQDAPANAVRRASLVTVCIGANDILQTAMSHLEDYILTGSLAEIEAEVEANLAALDDDSNASSYKALLDRLTELNPSAAIVLTTVYNPYKYLWIEEGHHGFFEPVMDAIPDMEFTVAGAAVDFDSFLKDSLLGTPIVQQLFDRVNGLGDWVEAYVTRLDAILKAKVAAHANASISVADAKALFDGVPDREVDAPYHYNDLVSVEYTRGYDYMQMDWGRLYGDGGAGSYWAGMFSRHGLDIAAIAAEFVEGTVTEVVVPDVDPHPEEYGHYVLKRSFADAIGWQALDRHRITYAANGGSGSMAEQVVPGVDGLAAYAPIAANGFSPATGHYFTGWADAAGTSYSAGQLVGVSSDLALSAQWSNVYTLTYRVTNNTGGLYADGSNSGPQDAYALRIGGGSQSLEPKFSNFSQGAKTYQVAYGTQVEVLATCYTSASSGFPTSHNGRVYRNGASVAEAKPAYFSWSLTGDTDVRFDWVISGTLYLSAASWWDCYITDE